MTHESVVGALSWDLFGRGREVSDRSAALVPVTLYRSAAPVQPLTLTVDQAATVLGVARSTAYELVRAGDIQASGSGAASSSPWPTWPSGSGSMPRTCGRW